MKGYLKNSFQVAFHVTGMQGAHTASDYLINNRVRELAHAPYAGIGSFMRATACYNNISDKVNYRNTRGRKNEK
ncbi:hypothetical protein [Eikenella halliae]|uniref:hypothetical protein n=1 Tax=Eikenella halliae TaxID=1795832 RepID=UPI003623DD78